VFIYLIVNHETGKYYVGQHKGNNLKKYLQQKFNHAQSGVSENSKLFRSMRAHPDQGVWSIHALRSDIIDKTELDQVEQDFIAFLRSQDAEYGYNICRGGEGFTGPHTEKTKEKMSNSHKGNKSNTGRNLPAEHRQKIGDALRNKALPDNTKLNMSKAARKRPLNHPSLQNLSNGTLAKGMKGRHHSKETLRKMREVAKNRPSNYYDYLKRKLEY
jgi:hypothetical protein